jgi:hypothetical protein
MVTTLEPLSAPRRRIKRAGRRWSESGLLDWLKITFYKTFKPELWTYAMEQSEQFPQNEIGFASDFLALV